MNPLSSILLAATGIEADRSATFTSTVVIAGIVIVLGILVLPVSYTHLTLPTICSV